MVSLDEASARGAIMDLPDVSTSTRRTLLLTLFAVAVSGPAAGEDQLLSIGFTLLDEGSYKFGEYTGLVGDRAYFLGDMVSYSDLPDDKGRVDLEAYDLGLPSRQVALEYGKQGLFSLQLEYGEIPHFEQPLLLTPYRLVGDHSLVLPSDWQTGPDVQSLTELNSSLGPYEASTQRRKLGAGGGLLLPGGWSFDIDYARETKQGMDTTAGLFGTELEPRSALIPVPVDYTTDLLEFGFGLARDRGSVDLGYRFSGFRNGQDWLTFESMFDNFALAATRYPKGYGRIALDPDNDAHYVQLDAIYRLGAKTRASIDFRWGRLQQDQNLYNYTATPGIPTPIPTPRTNADTRVDTIHLDFAFSSRPARGADIKLRYAFDDRDNKTVRAAFFTVVNDSSPQASGADERSVLINQPFDRRRHFVALDGGYRFSRAIKVTAGADFRHTTRSYVAVDAMREWTARAKLILRPLPEWSSWLAYVYSDRSGSEYVSNRAFVTSHTPAYLGTQTSGNPPPNPLLIFNDPLLRRFFIADQQAHRIDLYSSFAATDSMTLGIKAGYHRAENDESFSGLRERSGYEAGLDVGFDIGPRWRFTAFAEYLVDESRQKGYAWLGSDPNSTLPPLRTPTNAWRTDASDSIVDVGGGVAWSAVPEKLDLALDYMYSNAMTEYDQTSGALPAIPLPEITTVIHSLKAQIDFQLAEAMVISVIYRHERYDNDDFAFDGVAVDSDRSTQPVIFANERAFHYQVNAIGATATYNF
jgi:MtrB/PioB family decaheme-associated outer membrane protein